MARDSSSTGPSPDPLHKYVFLGKSVEPALMDFTKSFNVVLSDLYLANFVPQGDVCFVVNTRLSNLSPG